MPLLLNDVLEIKTFTWQLNQLGINVLHWKVTSVTGTPATNDIEDLYSTAIAAIYKPLLNTGAQYLGTSLAILTGGAFVPTTTSNNGAGFGTGLGNPMPLQTTGIITKKTGFPGRANRGRVYIPFPAINDQDGMTGNPTVAYVNKAQTLANYISTFHLYNIVAGVTAAELTGVLYHRSSGTTTVLNGSVARSKWGVQHRRGSYGKPNALPVL